MLLKEIGSALKENIEKFENSDIFKKYPNIENLEEFSNFVEKCLIDLKLSKEASAKYKSLFENLEDWKSFILENVSLIHQNKWKDILNKFY